MIRIDFNILILINARFFIAFTGTIILGEIPPMQSTSFIDVVSIDEDPTCVPQTRLFLDAPAPLYVVTHDGVYHYIGPKEFIKHIIQVGQKSMSALPDTQTSSTD